MRPVGVSKDFLAADGTNLWGDIGLSALEDNGIAWEYLDTDVEELRPEDIDGRPALIFAGPAVTSRTFDGVREPPLLLARFGVGYDAVDIQACTDHNVAVTITPDGARRPVATAALGLLLAVQLNIGVKDRLMRNGVGRWDERVSWMGKGLTGKTLGLVGFGSTASDLAALVAPFKMTVLAYDPYCPPERAEAAGVQLVALSELAEQSDAIVVMALLTNETHHLLDTDFFNTMKADATIVNVARGPIIDEVALTHALQNGRIRAAGLDVFESEPVDPSNPLLTLDNVTLAPHSIAWTDEMSLGNGQSAVQAVLDVLSGLVPTFVVNRELKDSPDFLSRLSGQTQPQSMAVDS